MFSLHRLCIGRLAIFLGYNPDMPPAMQKVHFSFDNLHGNVFVTLQFSRHRFLNVDWIK